MGLDADRVDGRHAEQIVAAARARKGLDADTVDGLDSTQLVAVAAGNACPPATTFAGGACVENAARPPAAYAAAAAACGADGRRLVPPDVLLHARGLPGIDLGAGEISSDVTIESAAVLVLGPASLARGYTTISDAGAIAAAALTTATAFRCMTR